MSSAIPLLPLWALCGLLQGGLLPFSLAAYEANNTSGGKGMIHLIVFATILTNV
jgi:hypothetical protein